jgi:hypothetical protein
MARTVIAVFDSKYMADKAVYDLHENGLASDMIEMFARPILKKGTDAKEQKHKRVPAEITIGPLGAGTHIGAGIGGAVGIAAGLLIISGALSVPILTGSALPWISILLAVVIVGAMAGGLVGSLLGGLLGLAISEEELQQYARIVREDQVVVAVLAEWGLVDPVLQILHKHNPLEIEEKPYSQRITGRHGTTTSSPQVQSIAQEHEEHR